MVDKTDVPAGQDTHSFDSLGFFPATVEEHTERSDGMTLHTIDPDPDTDIEIYDDDRAAHRSGNPPEA